MSPVEKLKNDIRMARFTYIVTDPYPQVTQWENNQHCKGYLEKKIDVLCNRDLKPDISVHQAYREGMQFMWELIERAM